MESDPSGDLVDERSSAYGWVRRALYGGGGRLGSAWRTAATPLAWMWRTGADARLRGHLGPPSVRLSAPTISVGNVTVGGGGKTSLSRWLVTEGVPAGTRVAVLSRGYGRVEDVVRVVAPGGEADSRRMGDEPILLARAGAWVGVGASRIRAARALAAATDVDCYVLDDGLQHRRVARSLDLVTFLASDLEAPARCLPGGPLRQGPGWRPPVAGWVVVGGDPRETKWPIGTIGSAFADWWEELPGTPAAWADAGTVALGAWHRGEERLLETGSRRAVAIAGVARPATVRTFAEAVGWRVTRVIAFPDHHLFSRSDVARVVADHPRALVLVTEKDAAKLDPAWFGERNVGVLRRRLAPREPDLLQELVRDALGREP